MKITPLHAFVCDDIRVEDSGKHMMIGIYTGNIRASVFPTTLRLCTWLSFEIKHDEDSTEPTIVETKIEVQLDDDDQEMKELTAAIRVEQADPRIDKGYTEIIEVPQTGAELRLPCEGELRILTRRKGGKWKQLLTKRVVGPDD